MPSDAEPIQVPVIVSATIWPTCRRSRFKIGVEIDHVAIALGSAHQTSKHGALPGLFVRGEKIDSP